MKARTWQKLAAAALLAAAVQPAAAWDRHDAAVDVEVVSDRGGYLRQYPVSGGADLNRASR